MSQIIVTAIETFGPFSTVETLEDRYLCDGELGLPFAVIGTATVQDAAGYAPPAPPPIVPQEVTRRQALQVLFLHGITETDVEAIINTLPSPSKELTLIEFRTSQTFQRQRTSVIQIGGALGLNLDEFFIEASQLL